MSGATCWAAESVAGHPALPQLPLLSVGEQGQLSQLLGRKVTQWVSPGFAHVPRVRCAMRSVPPFSPAMLPSLLKARPFQLLACPFHC